MWRYIIAGFIMLVLFSCGGDSQQIGSDNADDLSSTINVTKTGALSNKDIKAEYVKDEILVKFKKGADKGRMSALHNALRITKIKEIGRLCVQHLKIPHNLSVEEAVKFYESDPQVEYAEPNYVLRIAAEPNDPDFDKLWSFENTGQTGGSADADIDAPKAWDITTGSDNIIIAIIDTGVAYNHPDLSENIWINMNEIEGNGIDDDSNGYIDDIYGWDFLDNDGYPEDLNSHGTHVAGIIAARGNNGIGITGIMWKAKIMTIRFLGVRGSGDTNKAADAIIYAADNGARVINASWAGYGYSKTLYNAIDYARKKDVLFVAAAGNDSNDNDSNPVYPSSYDLQNIISVTATDENDNLASFSNYGTKSVDLAAPGVNIYSLIPIFTYGAPVMVYSENFDSESGALPLLGWSRGGTNSRWAVTTGTGLNGTNSLEDSPDGNYLPNTNSWAGYMTPITVVKNNWYTLSFKWKGQVNSLSGDYLNINFSENGEDWDWVDYTYGNPGGSFTTFSTDLFTEIADFYDSFYFGFGMEAGFLSSFDGVYIDDVVLKREPVQISQYAYESDDWTGTSMATSHVAGVAGLILSEYPSLSYKEVKNSILNSVDTSFMLVLRTSSGGRLNASNAVRNIVPSAPSDLNAKALLSSEIELFWTDNSSNEEGFRIERKTYEWGSYSEIATVYEDETSYSDKGLFPNTKYYYRVRAYNDAGDSESSNEASATTKWLSSEDDVGGGCSVGKIRNYQTAVADTVILLLPFIVLFVFKYYSKNKF